jgi:hypothetical protein
MNDIVMILVYTFPMFLFTIFPGIYVSDYLQKKYAIKESTKRGVMVSVTFLGAFILGALLQFA